MSLSVAAVAVATAACAAAAVVVVTDGALLAVNDDAALSPGAARALADRERGHAALSFARLLALLAAGATFGALLTRDRIGHGAVVATVFCVLAVAVCESAARTLGDVLGARILAPLAPIARAAAAVFAPVSWAGARLDARLAGIFPAPVGDDESRDAAAEQFLRVVAAEADVSQQGEALLAGVFSLGETDVQDVMVPRVRVVGIEEGTPWSEVVDRVRSSGHARYPVFRETLDDIVGVLYAKDLLGDVLAGHAPASGWESLARPPMFIPATKATDELLREFRASGTHLAVVIDEYGGTAGLVTFEDLLEQIVGEIRDEHDEEEPEFERGLDASHFWASGRMLLSELCELVDYEFPSDEVSTVGGLVYEALGRVPRAGESLVVGPFRLVVERVIRRRIERVYFERVSTPEVHDDA